MSVGRTEMDETLPKTRELRAALTAAPRTFYAHNKPIPLTRNYWCDSF
jgi:hypothetical protein